MARKTLVDADIRRIRPTDKQFKIKDANGLLLLVMPSGTRLWRYRYEIGGKESMCSLGAYPEVSLADARKARDEMRKLVKQGVSPVQHRKVVARLLAAQTENSFEAVAREWMRSKKKWRASYRKQVETILGNDVFPTIGSMPMDKVTAADIREIIKRKAASDATTVAHLIRQWCVAIGHYAIADGKAEVNVAASLKGLIEVKPRTHHNPLTEADIPVFIERLNQEQGTESVRLALRLLLLTFVRPGEVRCAEWHEFDLTKKLWTIPAARMKKGREHMVPLSSQVIKLLARLREINKHPRLLFPNVRDSKRPMSPTTLNRFLERIGYGGIFSAHGFRATASTILNSQGYNPDVIERQLAHLDPSLTRRSYNRSDYMHDRTSMMKGWADHIDSLVKKKAASKAAPKKR